MTSQPTHVALPTATFGRIMKYITAQSEPKMTFNELSQLIAECEAAQPVMLAPNAVEGNPEVNNQKTKKNG